MNFKNISKIVGHCARAVVCSMVVVVSTVMPLETVEAHGERNQEPFLRMRTIHWYDVEFSKPADSVIPVNEELVITGKFRLFSKWASQLPDPEKMYLNAASAGAVFTKVESWVNGRSTVQSFKGELGRDYEFKMVIKARWEGTWHVHPMLNVYDAGGLIGPGVTYTVGGHHSDYVQSMTTIDGTFIENMETYALDRVYSWHALWAIFAVIWLLWWIRRPLLLPRYLMTKQGDYEDVLVTKTDRIFSAAFLIVVLFVAIGGALVANAQYPRTITLQAGLAIVPPLPITPAPDVEMLEGKYYIPGRTVIARTRITNTLDVPVRLGEFSSANLRFLDRTVQGIDDGSGKHTAKDLIANSSLLVSNNSFLAPGETREVTIEATDAAWELERLSSLLNDPESTLGALLFFYDEQGNRYISELFGNMIPVYKN